MRTLVVEKIGCVLCSENYASLSQYYISRIEHKKEGIVFDAQVDVLNVQPSCVSAMQKLSQSSPGNLDAFCVPLS
jgi:hypothetical protein